MDDTARLAPSVDTLAGSTVKRLNLALQGGGAHGAFTWGVLDRLLEDERIAFDGITATSAGAMNAAVLAYGLAAGGREGARQALAGFWRRISRAALAGPLQPSPLDRLLGNHSLSFSPAFLGLDLVTRLMSPYDFNPFNLNPLRDVLRATVDFDVLAHAACPVKLFISATNVETGKVRVFERREVTVDAVMASACLPFLFQAVEIDGEHYWDGGYMGNPALFPVIYNCAAPDILVSTSTRWCVAGCRGPRRRSSTGSTRSASTPRSCARCGRSASSRSWSRTGKSPTARCARC
jgi:NTE family protein